MTLILNFPGPTNTELLSFGQDPDSILPPLSETIAPVYNPFKRPVKATLIQVSETEPNLAASARPAGPCEIYFIFHGVSIETKRGSCGNRQIFNTAKQNKF